MGRRGYEEAGLRADSASRSFTAGPRPKWRPVIRSERPCKSNPLPPVCHRHLPLARVAPSPVQPGLESSRRCPVQACARVQELCCPLLWHYSF